MEGGIQKSRGTFPVRVLFNPFKVAKTVLPDLHIASISGVQDAGVATEDFPLDVNNWATFCFVYRVI